MPALLLLGFFTPTPTRANMFLCTTPPRIHLHPRDCSAASHSRSCTFSLCCIHTHTLAQACPRWSGLSGPGWVSPTVLKLLKMATGMRALLDTVVQALPQVRAAPPPTWPSLVPRWARWGPAGGAWAVTSLLFRSAGAKAESCLQRSDCELRG